MDKKEKLKNFVKATLLLSEQNKKVFLNCIDTLSDRDIDSLITLFTVEEKTYTSTEDNLLAKLDAVIEKTT